MSNQSKKEDIMKRLATTLTFSLLVISILFAGHRPTFTTLQLSLWDHSAFTVEIGDRTYKTSSGSIEIDGLRSGRKFMKVSKEIRRHNGYYKKVIFKGMNELPSSSKVKARITKHRDFDIIKVKRIRHGSIHGINSQDHHGNHGQNSHDHSFSEYGINGHAHQTGHNGYHSDVMSQGSFRELRRIVDETSFDSSKLLIVKQALGPKLISSQQVLLLMELFAFDSNRLEVAKYAYTFTYDQEKYFLVSQGLSFSGNVSRLNQYISSYHFQEY